MGALGLIKKVTLSYIFPHVFELLLSMYFEYSMLTIWAEIFTVLVGSSKQFHIPAYLKDLLLRKQNREANPSYGPPVKEFERWDIS